MRYFEAGPILAWFWSKAKRARPVQIRLFRLFLACLLGFAAVSSAEEYVIAHFPYGGGWAAKTLLANGTANDVTVELAYLSQDGRPISVPLENLGNTRIEQIRIGPNEVKSVSVDPKYRNTGALQVAWATAKADGPLSVFTLFDYAPTSVPSTIPSTNIVTAVGAPSSPAGQSFRFPASINGATRYNAGLAVANPNNVTAHIRLDLLDAEGTVKATHHIALTSQGQTTMVLTDVESFKAAVDPSALFTGSVGACADRPVGFLALGIEGNVFFTVAVSSDYRCN
jgi:hypothetical protein